MPRLPNLCLYHCVLLALAFSQAVFAQSVTNSPVFAIGDRWVMRTIDAVMNQEVEVYETRVTAISGDNLELERIVRSSAGKRKVRKAEKRVADAATWTFASANVFEGKLVVFDFPLSLGKTWEYQFVTLGRKPEGVRVTIKRKVVVEGWEEVRVPAGKFKALKVVHTGVWTQVNANGTQTETLWYVPESKWWVRRDFHERTASGATLVHVKNELTEVRVR